MSQCKNLERGAVPSAQAEKVSTAVVSAIADERGVDPMDLEFCLAEYVDPDALNALAGGNGVGVREVTLRIDGLEVVVRSADAIEVSAAPIQSEGAADLTGAQS